MITIIALTAASIKGGTETAFGKSELFPPSAHEDTTKFPAKQRQASINSQKWIIFIKQGLAKAAIKAMFY